MAQTGFVYEEIIMSLFGGINFSDSGNVDAFQRLRVSNVETLFEVQNAYGLNAVKLESGSTGSQGVAPAWDSNTRMVTLSCSAGSGTSWVQSYQYFPYEPGKSHFVALTGVLGSGLAGAVKDIGYFDAANGIFLRQNGASGLQVVRRTSTSGSVVDTAVNSASWNLDTMDGTGPSGITFDVTKSFILVIDLQFLGMGRARIGLDINGILYYFHQFLNANVLSTPYMQTANLPIQALITATSTGNTATMSFKCATVQSEGGKISPLGRPISTPEGTVTAASGARTHLLSIIPKLLYGGIANRAYVILDNINFLITGANPVLWELVVGASFSVAPTFADINTNFSANQYGTGGTFSGLTSGFVLASGFISGAGTGGAANPTAQEIPLGANAPISLNRAGAVVPMGTLSLIVTGVGGASASRATMNIQEIH